MATENTFSFIKIPEHTWEQYLKQVVTDINKRKASDHMLDAVEYMLHTVMPRPGVPYVGINYGWDYIDSIYRGTLQPDPPKLFRLLQSLFNYA